MAKKKKSAEVTASEYLPDTGIDTAGAEDTTGTEPEQVNVVGMPRITEKEVEKAAALLQEYKSGKAMLEQRVVDDEQWWRLRHWDTMGKRKDASEPPEPRPSSAWLFNAIVNKHADAMDNFPEPVALARERSDEESAKIISSVLPVVLEENDFEQSYSDNWDEKLKHGTAVYGVFWNAEKQNGIGDVDIRPIDLLKVFWEPGITDIQKSANLFIVELVDNEQLRAQYPDHDSGKLQGNTIEVARYLHDDSIDTSDKSLVVDWYYKRRSAGGKTVLHYCKFVGNEVLYATENDESMAETGLYDHGDYPVHFDVLFHEKDTPCGFGYVAICKDPQLYIDRLSANILESALMNTKKRFFVSGNSDINEKEFLDWNKPIVHCEGELDDKRVKEIVCQPLSAVYNEVLQMKIEEMKDTAANRDVNSGGYGSGVTAAAAIAALQEAGNKVSRDMIAASYRCYTGICKMCVELFRQFYDEQRTFRVVGEQPGTLDYIGFDNSALKYPINGEGEDGTLSYRKPIFDIKIRAQKKNPFSRIEQNEMAKEMFAMGFFNPERATEASAALCLMEFEGKDKVEEKISEGQTLYNMMQQMSQQMNEMAAIISQFMGKTAEEGLAAPTATGAPAPGAAPTGAPEKSAGKFASGVMQAETPMTGYGERVAKNSTPEVKS